MGKAIFVLGLMSLSQVLYKENPMNCPSCGRSNLPDANFCDNCGTRLPKEVSQQQVGYMVVYPWRGSYAEHATGRSQEETLAEFIQRIGVWNRFQAHLHLALPIFYLVKVVMGDPSPNSYETVFNVIEWRLLASMNGRWEVGDPLAGYPETIIISSLEKG
jgi:hypothetical protein